MRVHGSVSYDPLMMTSVPCKICLATQLTMPLILSSFLHEAITKFCNQRSISLDDLL